MARNEKPKKQIQIELNAKTMRKYKIKFGWNADLTKPLNYKRNKELVVTYISPSALRDQENIERLTLPSDHYLDPSDVKGCTKLESISIKQKRKFSYSELKEFGEACPNLITITTLDGEQIIPGRHKKVIKEEPLVYVSEEYLDRTTKLIGKTLEIKEHANIGFGYGPVKSIHSGAFKSLSEITRIKIPSTITYIGPKTFEGLNNLEEITWKTDKKLKRSEIRALKKACPNLKKIFTNNEVIPVKPGIFKAISNAIKEQQRKNRETQIERTAAKKEKHISNSQKNDPTILNKKLVKKMNLKLSGHVDIEKLVDKKGNKLPIKTISDAFVDNKKVTSIKIPKGVHLSFATQLSGCENLKEIIWDCKYPERLSKEDIEEFKKICPKLEKIVYNGEEIQVRPHEVQYYKTTFDKFDAEKHKPKFSSTFKVPEFESRHEDIYTFIKIGPGAFKDLEGIKEIKLPKTIEEILPGAFEGCDTITTIEWNPDKKLSKKDIDKIVEQIKKECPNLEFLKINGDLVYVNYSLTKDDVTHEQQATTYTKDEEHKATNTPNVTSYGTKTESINQSYTSPTKESIVEPVKSNVPERTSYSEPGNTKPFKHYDPAKHIDITSMDPYIADRLEVRNPGDPKPFVIDRFNVETHSKCEGTTLTIPETINYSRTFFEVNKIATGTFAETPRVTVIVLPETITTVAPGAFIGCKNLEELVWAAKKEMTQEILEELKRECPKLETINYKGEQLTVQEVETKINTPTQEQPVQEINKQQNETQTNVELTRENLPESNIKIGNKVTIPTEYTKNGVTYEITSIGDYAFAGCKEIDTVIIPETVTSVGTNAFAGCEKLATVIWDCPSQLRMSVIEDLFENCPNLQSFVYHGRTISKQTIDEIITEKSSPTDDEPKLGPNPSLDDIIKAIDNRDDK